MQLEVKGSEEVDVAKVYRRMAEQSAPSSPAGCLSRSSHPSRASMASQAPMASVSIRVHRAT